MGAELESEYNPLEAGLARPKVKSADFIGKEAYLAAREPVTRGPMCTLTVDDHTDSQRHRPLHARRQRADRRHWTGNAIVDSTAVSRVTTAGYGPSVGKTSCMGYLPDEIACAAPKLQVDVHERAVPRDGGRHRRFVRPDRSIAAMKGSERAQ